MTTATPEVSPHPSGDKRLKMLDATMKRHQYQQDALIEILHKAQELYGYLENDLLLYIAHKLKLPPSRVYGVATFYHLFSLAPQGVHSCVICTGTACYVKGSQAILTNVEKAAQIRAAVVFDGTVLGNQTPESVCEWLRHCEAERVQG
jgi:bidirectional [NiFe] hydrogenase diaphorase subunit